MDLARYLALGIDAKRADYAACTFADIHAASTAAHQYQKLGVVPSLVDLGLALSGCTGAKPGPGVVLPLATRNADNPTTFRIARWLILALADGGSFSYTVASDIASALAKALALAGQGRACAVVSLNSGLKTHQVPAGAKVAPPRIDMSVTVGSTLQPQFAVASFKSSDSYNPHATEPAVGANWMDWYVYGEFDALADAYALADGMPGSFVYDRDNGMICYCPGSASGPLACCRKWPWGEYLRLERGAIENEVVRGLKGQEVPTTAEGMAELLNGATAGPRRSGQTPQDRAKDWEALL